MVRTSDIQLKDSRSESLGNLFSPCCSSSFGCIKEYLAIDSGGY